MTAILELTGVGRDYRAAGQTVPALKGVDLVIGKGEMVAIVGASGSGKSTLMNILGCLDRPTSGRYLVSGEDASTLDADALARLRLEHFGFIFQRYHLLAHLSAMENVEVPAIYAGTGRPERRKRARALLERLGLADRLDHRPEQLSGGQQQRVSIARALINGGQVILADEPTGALDRRSGAEMMALLQDLNQRGHTIVIVTHSPDIALHAGRIIELSDGMVVSDRSNPRPLDSGRTKETATAARRNGWRAECDRLAEAGRMAILAMMAHRLRSFLTMLGIIIGIASVVSVVALGEGSHQRILEDINAIGTNTLEIFPGKDFGDERAAAIRTLRADDAEALASQPYVDSVTPAVSAMASLRWANLSLNGSISGVGQGYFRVRGYSLAEGRFFTERDVERQSQDVVIDANTRLKLFQNKRSPLGEVIFLGDVPARVVGVAAARANAFGNSENLNVWIPYTTAMTRLLGQDYLKSITVRIRDGIPADLAEQAATETLRRRHGTQDFFVMNTDTIRQTVDKANNTMTLLISLIAVISLVVGGIGVMNIMLVSVTERTREIGVRIAVGARQTDIMRQFLIEAVLVCLAGGALGVMLALSAGLVVEATASQARMIYSTASIVAAFVCSTSIGIIFGFLPARAAARLDPVEALARE